MDFKFGQLSLLPYRDNILSQMSASCFQIGFPISLVIIDGTELKAQVPNTLEVQSHLNIDYKSSATLKALVDCDPSEYVVFISGLFTGYILDKAICEQSGGFPRC